MEIGKKIKKVRTSKGMTQTELAGDKITRNMLSQIENGSAAPSLSTIVYIADKLGMPAGYFLCEPRDDLSFRKMVYMDEVKKAYRDGEYQKCAELCKNAFSEYDDEINMILCECHFRLGRELFALDRLKSASDEFCAALRYAEKTLYNVDWIRVACSVHLEFIGELIPSLQEKTQALFADRADALVFTDMHKYVTAKRYTEQDGENERDVCTSDFANPALARHIEAKIKMKKGEYAGALELMRDAVSDESAGEYGCAFLFALYSDMEVCFREVKDFEHAYECTVKKSELLLKMQK